MLFPPIWGPCRAARAAGKVLQSVPARPGATWGCKRICSCPIGPSGSSLRFRHHDASLTCAKRRLRNRVAWGLRQSHARAGRVFSPFHPPETARWSRGLNSDLYCYLCYDQANCSINDIRSLFEVDESYNFLVHTVSTLPAWSLTRFCSCSVARPGWTCPASRHISRNPLKQCRVVHVLRISI